MKTKSRRLLSALLTVMMAFGLFAAFPLTAGAEDSGNENNYDTLLDEYIRENYSGEITVAIAAARPVANSRVAIDLGSLLPGHTYIRLDYGDGNVLVRGYGAVDNLSLKEIKDNTTVDGKLYDDGIKEWHAAIVYEITFAQADKIKEYIDDFDPGSFNLIFNNCTTFAVNALTAAGIPAPTREHLWTLPGRAELIAAMPPYVINREAFANELLSRIYYGYTPADAVQDFKSHPNCILKYDGTLHKP